MSREKRRVRPAGLIAAALSLTLIGCGTPPWEQLSQTPTPTAPASPTPTSTPTPTPTVRSVVNELAGGSTEHQISAGDIQLTARYWSTLGMDKWTAGASKPLTVSLSGVLGHDNGQRFYLSRVTMVTQVNGPEGTLPAPAPVSDKANVSPGYQVEEPYSYSQVFVLPAVDPTATGVVLTFSYELLLQTTRRSQEYSKQTASDSLTIALAP